MEPRFSIGTYTKKKTPRIKKRPISKPNYIFNKPIDFKIYSGHRWSFPGGIPASNSIKYKFSSLENIYYFSEIKQLINSRIKNIKFDFGNITEWNPPSYITNSIRSYRAKQENEWNKVRFIYFKLFKFKKILLSILNRVRIIVCLRNCKNTEDPVTLDIPKNPIYIVDFTKRLSFVYEASSLRKTIENKILFSDYMFPDPKNPVNILTNEHFTLGQFYHIVKECKRYGEYSWILDSLRSLHFNIPLFTAYNQQKLKIEAINVFFKKSSFLIREVVIDYFNLEAYNHYLIDNHIEKFIKTYDTRPDTPIIRSWINTTRDYYIARELKDPYILTKVTNQKIAMIKRICRYFL